MSPLMDSCADRGRQRGAIGLMAALTLGLALIFFLLVIDSGRLYLEKRSLQRIADTAALEAATLLGQCTPTNTASVYAIAAATRNGFTVTDNSRTLTTDCGTLTTGADNLRAFSVNAGQNQAIRVVVTHAVAQSIAGGVAGWTPLGSMITLSATAVATVAPPLAMLTIRSTLLAVDSTSSPILNALVGGMLGGSLNLDAVGWNGLINTNINLLQYLNQLKLDLGITAVGYTQVLGTSVSIGQLIQSAITVLGPSGTLNANLNQIKVAAGTTSVVLGDILQVKGGTETAALNASVQLFQLIEGFAQLSNKNNGVAINQNINLGVANVSTMVLVLQPPQISAVGNPALAALNPLGPDRIYVRTAQIRALISVNLPVLDALSPLITNLNNGISSLISPLSNTLKSLLGLDIVGALSSATCLLGAGCQTPSVVLLPPPVKIGLNIDVASGSSYVTAYSCPSPTNKSLTTNTLTSLLNINIGNIDPTSAFSTNNATPPPTTVVAKPLELLDIGVQTCYRFLIFPSKCDPRIPNVGGGIGISFNSPVGQSQGSGTPHTYLTSDPTPLPNINQQPPDYFSFTSNTNLVSSLYNTIAGVQVQAYQPSVTNPMSTILTLVAGALTGVTTALQAIIQNALSPILDPLINTLLASLGINLNQVDVGANLSCSAGRASLVI
ncbi:pilus assembly protein TadG-related protein [Pseudomonas sp. NA-150]|uniref:pilus assembly protein TadG-related protein n=1 Tax=Pseudomonas sp. NA-150 TaxID=3367525 RepID=UPI0037C9F06F